MQGQKYRVQLSLFLRDGIKITYSEQHIKVYCLFELLDLKKKKKLLRTTGRYYIFHKIIHRFIILLLKPREIRL